MSGARRWPAPAANTTPATLSDMRTTRWLNRSLPQLLQYANMLLYFEAAFAFLSLLNVGFGSSAYYFVYYFFSDSRSLNDSTLVVSIIVFIAALVYVYAGWAIANEQKRGWMAGVAVASGAVVLPLVTYGPGILATQYLFSYLFNVALVVLLVHRESRNYQRIWFH